MKFRRLNLIRHINGTAEFEVVAVVPEGMYVLRKVGESPLYSMASNLVDSMFIGVSPGNQTKFEKIAALALGYGMKPDIFLDNFVSKIKFVPKVKAMEAAAVRNCPTVASPASDVTVSLPGLPAGYYLKAFRKALPGDLVLNTSGVVVPAKITQNGMTLYRPIVGKMSNINMAKYIPGLPHGWTVVEYRVPKGSDQYLDAGEVREDATFHPSTPRMIVQRTPSPTPCDGTLPGIPKGYKLVGFGAVKEDQFFIDTVGTLKPGPAKNRLVLEYIPARQPEVVTEYELEVGGVSFWTSSPIPKNPIGRTGRTRKVVVQ